MRGWVTAMVMLLLGCAWATAAPGQELDPVLRGNLERALWKAQTAFEYLAVAEAFGTAGYVQRAKQITDAAASRADRVDEWIAVSSTYRWLGYGENADVALRRARDRLR